MQVFNERISTRLSSNRSAFSSEVNIVDSVLEMTKNDSLHADTTVDSRL